MDFVLLGGLWMEPAAWNDTVRELESQGHRGYIVTLPGQGDGNDDATLDEQLAVTLQTVDGAVEPWIVGHSAACTLAWMAADKRRDAISGVAMIGGFPTSAGEPYAAFFPLQDDMMPFPGWGPFEGPDSADLTNEQKATFETNAIAVPEGVAYATVEYAHPDRNAIPVTLICPEFSPAAARGWIEAGDVPELAHVEHVTYVDLNSGHWPMISQPDELARVLANL